MAKLVEGPIIGLDFIMVNYCVNQCQKKCIVQTIKIPLENVVDRNGIVMGSDRCKFKLSQGYVGLEFRSLAS